MSNTVSEEFSLAMAQRLTEDDQEYARRMNMYFAASPGKNLDKLRNFAKYVPRQAMSLFLARAELCTRILSVHGHIIECGVYLGNSLLTWGELSAIHEPYNHTRRIIGFDTFSGFPSLHEKDCQADAQGGVHYACKGGLAADAETDIREAIELYDLNRPLGHIPRIELVRGDARDTIPTFIEENRHLVVAMLSLDFDLYEPTLAALEHFVPRMPRGGLIVFDELNQKEWPGETEAVFETLGLRQLRIERFPFTPALSFAVLD